MQIIFSIPGPETPGYLRRIRAALEFRELISQGNQNPELIDKMIEFLAPYVEEPADRAEAKEALLDATQMQYEELLAAIAGGSPENPT